MFRVLLNISCSSERVNENIINSIRSFSTKIAWYWTLIYASEHYWRKKVIQFNVKKIWSIFQCLRVSSLSVLIFILIQKCTAFITHNDQKSKHIAFLHKGRVTKRMSINCFTLLDLPTELPSAFGPGRHFFLKSNKSCVALLASQYLFNSRVFI